VKTVFDVLTDQARTSGRERLPLVGGVARRRLPLSLRIFFAIVLTQLLILIGVISFYAQYSGVLRWAALFLVLSVVGLVLAVYMLRDLPRFRPLRRGAPTAAAHGGELARLVYGLRRGGRGSRYNQARVLRRLREACLARLVVVRDLPPDRVDALLTTPEALERELQDPFLAAFLIEATRLQQRWPQVLRHMKPRADFLAYVNTVLQHMERIA
jgi:hypothetical protein